LVERTNGSSIVAIGGGVPGVAGVEQSLNLGAHHKLLTYLAMYVEGAGSLALTSFIDSASAPQAQQALP
jgi:hypothetical protein